MPRDAISRLYDTARWRRRAAAQLAKDPLCAACRARGWTEEARAVDHIIPARQGDQFHFWSTPVQSLCLACHNAKRRADRGKPVKPWIGADGWPIS